MSYSFLFSNNPKYRIWRHLLFWIGCLSLYIVGYSFRRGNEMIGYGRFLQYTVLEILVLLSVDMLFCYAFIYQLLPKLLLPGKYIRFLLFMLLFLLLDASLSNYLYTLLIIPLRHLYHLPVYGKPTITDFLVGLNGTMMITGIACAIKLLKLRQVKEKELDLLKSEKLRAELKFIDSYIQPSFLPELLKKIYSYAYSSSNKVPEMLEKLHNIIRYLVNECNCPAVLLAEEIDRIKDFIQLEKLTNPEKLHVQFEQKGSIINQQIVPFILFPMVENNFRQLTAEVSSNLYVNIVFEINDSELLVELRNSKPVETSNLFNYETYNLQQIRKRLELLYPGSHKLGIIIEDQLFIIRLKLDLSKAIN